MTRLGHGALKPRRAAVELAEIIGRVRADLARSLAGHRLEIAVPRDLPMLDVDPVLIGQALTNVVENAAKYAPAGTAITIAARVDGREAEVRVSDEGPGIPSADREKVFDLFHRVTEATGAPPARGLALPSCADWWRLTAARPARAKGRTSGAPPSRCDSPWPRRRPMTEHE